MGAWLLGFTTKAQPVRESALWRARHEIMYEILLMRAVAGWHRIWNRYLRDLKIQQNSCTAVHAVL